MGKYQKTLRNYCKGKDMKPEDKKYFEALSERDLMGLCIFQEAKGEPREGRIAVGTVILERVDQDRKSVV